MSVNIELSYNQFKAHCFVNVSFDLQHTWISWKLITLMSTCQLSKNIIRFTGLKRK